MQGINRRTLVKSLAGVATLLAMPTQASRPHPRTLDVLIIGAGLSGLNAARILEEQGLKVMVVEASDHLGGRLRTIRTGDYQAEVGGSEVGPYYGRIRDVCARLNVELIDSGPKPTPFCIDVGGKLHKPDQWEASPANLTIGAERRMAPYTLQSRLFYDWVPFDDPADWLKPEFYAHDVSAAQYMRGKGVSEAAIRLAEIDHNGPSLAAVSAMSIMRDLARIKVEGFNDPTNPQYGAGAARAKTHYMKDGSDALPRAMAQALKGPVRIKTPAIAIDQDATGATISLATGERIRSRFVLVAAPFSAVRNITFTPALPPRQQDAVQGAIYSATTQFHFRITRPFWEEDGLPPSIWSDRLFERGFVIPNGGGQYDSLVIWLNGDGASRLNALDLPTQRALVLAELATARPTTKGALDPLAEYSWEKNSFVGGNKHCFAAGQVKSFASAMGDPHGRVYFSGEHLRRAETGMESAMETSEITALALLEKI